MESSAAEKVKSLMKRKDEIEAEIKELNDVLESVRCCGMFRIVLSPIQGQAGHGTHFIKQKM